MSSVGPQAPVGAVGYRLVFPSRTPDESPRLSPQLDGNGYQGSYSLTPFQAPYDIRLCDGQLYRVIWTGAVGEIILPKQDGTIPGLRFFLSEATLNAEAGSQTETSVGESAAASNESGTDATVIPIQARSRRSPVLWMTLRISSTFHDWRMISVNSSLNCSTPFKTILLGTIEGQLRNHPETYGRLIRRRSTSMSCWRSAF